MTKAIIGFHQLKIPCLIGLHPEERTHPQLLIVDVKIQLDLKACFKSEAIQETIDYVSLAEVCQRLAYTKHYFLLEIFAKEILDEYFHKFPLQWAWVRIQKPSALPAADYAYVELEREREEHS